MQTGVSIREFTLQDYDSLIRLWQAAGMSYKPNGRDAKSKIAREIIQPTAIFLVAEQDQKMIGAVFGTHDGRKGWINRLAVSPPHQGKGLARRLIEAVENRLEKAGIEIYACLIDEINETSIQVFEHSGYVFHHDIHYYCKRTHPEV